MSKTRRKPSRIHNDFSGPFSVQYSQNVGFALSYPLRTGTMNIGCAPIRHFLSLLFDRQA